MFNIFVASKQLAAAVTPAPVTVSGVVKSFNQMVSQLERISLDNQKSANFKRQTANSLLTQAYADEAESKKADEVAEKIRNLIG